LPVLQTWAVDVYTDDCIMASKDSSILEKATAKLAGKFEITDEGNVDKNLGVMTKLQIVLNTAN